MPVRYGEMNGGAFVATNETIPAGDKFILLAVVPKARYNVLGGVSAAPVKWRVTDCYRALSVLPLFTVCTAALLPPSLLLCFT
jgi:hypothetical protein